MCRIEKANLEDLDEILRLQYLAYQSEAALFGNKDIPPLKQKIDEVTEEYEQGLILKMIDENDVIIGSVRAKEVDGTVYIGKLMVHPNHRCKGHGRRLLMEIERLLRFRTYTIFRSLLFRITLCPFWIFLNIFYIGFNRRTELKVIIMLVDELLHLIFLWFSTECHLRSR